MIPEFADTLFGPGASMTKELTPSTVTFDFEGDATDEQIRK